MFVTSGIWILDRYNNFYHIQYPLDIPYNMALCDIVCDIKCIIYNDIFGSFVLIHNIWPGYSNTKSYAKLHAISKSISYIDIPLRCCMGYHMQYCDISVDITFRFSCVIWQVCIIDFSNITLDIEIWYCSTISQHDILCDIKIIALFAPVNNSDASSTDLN